MTERARVALTRIGLVVLLLVAIDGAITWYATDQAAGVVEEIETRDGEVVTDDSTLGMMHRTEIDIRIGDDGDRLARARFVWILGTLVAIGALLASGAAERDLARSVVMGGALTLAISLAPRAIYSDELPAIESVLG